MPAGRLKTVVLDLARIFQPGGQRRLRLRTNMEVYWDRLAWAEGLPSENIRKQSAALSRAELRYRGFSLITQAKHTAPELARYDDVVRTGEQWRSLEGYYTRYGDVKPLVADTDDRIVIANSRRRVAASVQRDCATRRGLVTRLRVHQRRLDQRGRLQLPPVENGPSAAVPRYEELHLAVDISRAGQGVSASALRLAGIPYKIRGARSVRASIMEVTVKHASDRYVAFIQPV